MALAAQGDQIGLGDSGHSSSGAGALPGEVARTAEGQLGSPRAAPAAVPASAADADRTHVEVIRGRLAGRQGWAWSVPDADGNTKLLLDSGEGLCIVSAEDCQVLGRIERGVKDADEEQDGYTRPVEKLQPGMRVLFFGHLATVLFVGQLHTPNSFTDDGSWVGVELDGSDGAVGSSERYFTCSPTSRALTLASTGALAMAGGMQIGKLEHRGERPGLGLPVAGGAAEGTGRSANGSADDSAAQGQEAQQLEERTQECAKLRETVREMQEQEAELRAELAHVLDGFAALKAAHEGSLKASMARLMVSRRESDGLDPAVSAKVTRAAWGALSDSDAESVLLHEEDLSEL